MDDTLEEILTKIRDTARIGWPGYSTIYLRWTKPHGWRASLNDSLYAVATSPTNAATGLLERMHAVARGHIEGHRTKVAAWEKVLGRDME